MTVPLTETHLLGRVEELAVGFCAVGVKSAGDWGGAVYWGCKRPWGTWVPNEKNKEELKCRLALLFPSVRVIKFKFLLQP